MNHPRLVLGMVASALTSPLAAARPVFIEAKLIAESTHPKAGKTSLVGLEMTPRAGWHGFWSNPGESGLAPVVKWRAPPGVHFGPLEHPAPALMTLMGMPSYVHVGPHILLARMAVDRKLPSGTALPISAEVTWAACSDKLCVPERASFSLRMTVGDGAPTAEAATLRTALAHEPRRSAPGSFAVRKGWLVLRLPPSVRLEPRKTRFFPDSNGYWDPLKAHLFVGKPITLVSPLEDKPRNIITGVVSDGSSAYRLSFHASTDK